MNFILDTNLIWWMAHPAGGPNATLLRNKVANSAARGNIFFVPEICDYEARRELIRKNAVSQLARLDRLISTMNYIALDTLQMQLAARLWAMLRNAGLQTAGNNNIDADMILAAQSLFVSNAIVVTKNIRHLNRVVNTMDWNRL